MVEDLSHEIINVHHNYILLFIIFWNFFIS